MKYFITGGAGFIGSNFVDRLMSDPSNQVTVYDNLSSGRREFLAAHENDEHERFKFIEGDLLDLEKVKSCIPGHNLVLHIAANPDIQLGTAQTDIDLKNGVQATYNLLEAMRVTGVNKIAYSSSSTVYGEADVLPTPIDYGPMMPISLYAASKLAAESYIMAFAHSFNMQAWIYRFANIIGRRGTHGVILDFINKLRKNPNELEILGDGRQQKSYLLVDECVDGILYGIEHANDTVNIFNLGSDDQIVVKRIGELIVEEMGLSDVEFKYTGGTRGWTGDVPKMLLDISRLKALGWKSKKNSEDAVRQAIRHVLNDE